MKINELLLVAPNRIEKRSRIIDAVADDEVIIKVVSCGLCSSEFPVINGETEGQPGVSYRYKSYPCNLGHEVSGIIFEVGKSVRNFQLGDRVTGLAYYGSGFSDYVIAPQEMLIKIPKDMPIEFALGEPVMVRCKSLLRCLIHFRMQIPFYWRWIYVFDDNSHFPNIHNKVLLLLAIMKIDFR